MAQLILRLSSASRESQARAEVVRCPYLCRLIELAEEVVERLHELADAEGRRQRSEPADVGEQDAHCRGLSKVQLSLGFS